MKKLLLLLLFLIPLFSFSQRKKNRDTSTVISQPNRIEFLITKESSEFFVVPGDTDGMLVVEETSKSAKGGGYNWRMYLIDTTLNVVWSQTQIIPAKGTLLGYEYFDGKFFLLFSKNAYRSEDLVVYQLTASTKEYLTYDITTVFPVEISHFESVDETLILAGSTNFRPVVITYNINDKIPRVIPGYYDNKNDILDIIVDKQTRIFTVVSSEKMKNKKFTVRVKSYTSNGDLVQDNLVNPGEKRSILDAASTTFSGGLQYLAGTYSKKSVSHSQGLYLSKFVNGSQKFNQYYPFADLTNFFEHLKPKREQRIKERIKRKKEKGKVKKFSYRLLVHEIIENDGEYVMLAEAYYPRYDYTSGGTYGGSFGNSSGYPYANFLGYRFTHAVVVGFDQNCNILWDHTFKIDDILSYSLDEKVSISIDGDRVALMYIEENEIRSKIVQGNEIVEGRTFNPVRLSFDSDQLNSKNSDVESLEKWYGNSLYAFGEQNIRNESSLVGDTHRRVFYINKVKYEVDKRQN